MRYFLKLSREGAARKRRVETERFGSGGPSQRRRWGLSALVLSLVVCSLLLFRPVGGLSQSAAKAPPTREIRRVLIINALGSSHPATISIDEAVRNVLDRSPYQIELYHEFLEETLFPEDSVQQKIRNSYIQKYQDRKPDLIIAVGLSAIRFMSDSHARLFPDTPIVFCGAIEPFAGNLKLDSDFAGTWMVPQPTKTLDALSRLMPGTKHVVVVGGSGKTDKMAEEFVREQFRPYEGKLDFTYLTDLEMPALLERLRHLPDNTIVFYTTFSRDAAGRSFIDGTQSVPLVARAANAPVFVAVDLFVGQGTVGGYVMSYAGEGKAAANIAIRILNGERPHDIPAVRSTDLFLFDWRALHRWGLKERDLPVGSTVLYRVPTAWELYRWQIEWAVLLLCGITALSVYLLFERFRRRRAEQSLVRQLRFESLISEISSEFISHPSSQVGQEIHASLVRLREFLGIDRVSIFESFDKGTCLRLRHSTRKDGVPSHQEVLSHADCPWLFQQLTNAEPIVLSRLDHLPNDSDEARELFRDMHADVIVISPLSVENELVGILVFVVLKAARNWSTELLPQLGAVTQLSANAFARELAQRALSESENRFKVIGDAAPAFLWMSDHEGKFTYLNRKTFDFTGAKPGELNGEGWTAYLHPDDLETALKRSAHALQQRERIVRNYRVRRHDGVYRWMFDIGNPRYDADGVFVGFIGSAVDVTDQMMAHEALERFGGQLIAAQEKERSHIARELHDDICQRLAMLSLRIERVTKASNGHGSVSDQLERIWQQCSDLTGDVQALSHTLHPSLLDNLGLVTAVKNFCREFSDQSGATVEFTEDNVVDTLPREVSLSLFRVVQEALHNSAKYSGGKSFKVHLHGTSHALELEVSDKGVGFDVEHLKNTEGLGLVSMRERIHLLNGTISIESQPNAGTTVRASVPTAA